MLLAVNVASGFVLAVLVGSMAALGGWTRAATAAQAPPAPIIEVAVQDGLLSVQLRDAPLADVLRAVGEQAGFEVVVREDVGVLVTRSFAHVPVEEGVRRLLENAESWSLVHAPASDDADEARLSEVRLYAGQGRRVPARAKAPLVQDQTQGQTGSEEFEPGDSLMRLQDIARKPAAAHVMELRTALGAEDVASRRLAAIALGRVGGRGAREALAGALEDSDEVVRLRAVQALGRIRSEEASIAIRSALLDDPSPDIRRFAVSTLARRHHETAIGALHAAKFDPDARVRRAVAHALRRLEDVRAHDPQRW